MKINFPTENPENKIVFSAGYVNSSAVQAELYRQQRYGKTSDSLFSLRLAEPKLMKAHLNWRPETYNDMLVNIEKTFYI